MIRSDEYEDEVMVLSNAIKHAFEISMHWGLTNFFSEVKAFIVKADKPVEIYLFLHSCLRLISKLSIVYNIEGFIKFDIKNNSGTNLIRELKKLKKMNVSKYAKHQFFVKLIDLFQMIDPDDGYIKHSDFIIDEILYTGASIDIEKWTNATTIEEARNHLSVVTIKHRRAMEGNDFITGLEAVPIFDCLRKMYPTIKNNTPVRESFLERLSILLIRGREDVLQLFEFNSFDGLFLCRMDRKQLFELFYKRTPSVTSSIARLLALGLSSECCEPSIVDRLVNELDLNHMFPRGIFDSFFCTLIDHDREPIAIRFMAKLFNRIPPRKLDSHSLHIIQYLIAYEAESLDHTLTNVVVNTSRYRGLHSSLIKSFIPDDSFFLGVANTIGLAESEGLILPSSVFDFNIAPFLGLTVTRDRKAIQKFFDGHASKPPASPPHDHTFGGWGIRRCDEGPLNDFSTKVIDGVKDTAINRFFDVIEDSVPKHFYKIFEKEIQRPENSSLAFLPETDGKTLLKRLRALNNKVSDDGREGCYRTIAWWGIHCPDESCWNEVIDLALMTGAVDAARVGSDTFFTKLAENYDSKTFSLNHCCIILQENESSEELLFRLGKEWYLMDVNNRLFSRVDLFDFSLIYSAGKVIQMFSHTLDDLLLFKDSKGEELLRWGYFSVNGYLESAIELWLSLYKNRLNHTLDVSWIIDRMSQSNAGRNGRVLYALVYTLLKAKHWDIALTLTIEIAKSVSFKYLSEEGISIVRQLLHYEILLVKEGKRSKRVLRYLISDHEDGFDHEYGLDQRDGFPNHVLHSEPTADFMIQFVSRFETLESHICLPSNVVRFHLLPFFSFME